jgi:uncharacterized protein (TIGR02246 family)
MHAGQYKDSHMTTISVAVRFLRPNVAIVHRAAEVVSARSSVKRRMFVTGVMTKQDSRWLIAAAQNTQRSGQAPKGQQIWGCIAVKTGKSERGKAKRGAG